MKSFTLISLGCPKNMVDSENIVGRLVSAGYKFQPKSNTCDFAIINTCGFLSSARDEAREYIDNLLELKEKGKIKYVFVTGCLVNFEKESPLAEFPQVDAWIGVHDEPRIVEIIDTHVNSAENQAGDAENRISDAVNAKADSRETPLGKFCFTERKKIHLDDTNRYLLTPKHVAYLKIADGCNRACAYCAIPAIRGQYVSKPQNAILEEAEKLAENGTKELIVIAQETTFWGSDLPDKPTLASLLAALKETEGIRWIRLMYTYPQHFEDELIDLFSDNASHGVSGSGNVSSGASLIPYIDIPLQHANDTILKNMRRQVNRHDTEMLLEKLRSRIKNLVLRTSLIAGFPGETDEMFGELVEFAQKWSFERGGVFAFSPEPGTAAEKMDDQLPEEIIEQRTDELREIQDQIAAEFDESRIGKRYEVLLDQPYYTPEGQRVPDVFIGRTFAEAPDIDPAVIVSANATQGNKLKPGEIINCEIVQVHDSNLIAVHVE
ncbi:MAG: 30S ribosomal protein S12 methylthiotransferase RimO [Thermoguttaceae bacterium]